jgi:MoxR-like ATPase
MPPTPDDYAPWSKPETGEWILGNDRAGSPPNPDPLTNANTMKSWAVACAKRVQALRKHLWDQWVGLEGEDGEGHLIDWLLAAAIAREHVLLLGEPGTAKSEIATTFFRCLGLTPPSATETRPSIQPSDDGLDTAALQKNWDAAVKAARSGNQNSFHYLLGKFTQPEELFGPVHLSLLRRGVLVRVNWGLLTGPGVRAAFLDEVFKASSSILNTLLTILQERTYFQWGAQVPADLQLVIGASNEMPGGSFMGFGGGGGGDEFNAQYAFVDRFPIRLKVPDLSSSDLAEPLESKLGQAWAKSVGRECLRVTNGPRLGREGGPKVCLNDLLFLGLATMFKNLGTPFTQNHPLFGNTLPAFDKQFMHVATALKKYATGAGGGQVTWSLSVRKLKALYKVALAYKVVTSELHLGHAVKLDIPDPKGDGHPLHAFSLIWDHPTRRKELRKMVQGAIPVPL